MALQPLTQGTGLPEQFGELLAEAPARLSRQHYPVIQEFEKNPNDAAARSHQPIPVGEKVSRFESNLTDNEQLVNSALTGFVEFVRQAGQDDEMARAFDNWSDGLDLATALDTYETQVVPGLREHAAILHSIVLEWNRLANAGVIEPDLPPHLTERVAQLDTHIRELTEAITSRHDNDLVARLLIRVGRHRRLTLAEQLRLADAVRLDWKVKGKPSVRRADWYGDDGQ